MPIQRGAASGAASLVPFVLSIVAAGVGLGGKSVPAAPVVLTETVIDPVTAGDVKMIVDIDGDGLLDPIVGGSLTEGLTWYRYPTFEATRIATPVVQFTTDGETRDVDGDGDMDIIVGDGNRPDNLVWFENPRPDGDPAIGEQWLRRTVGSADSWVKDIEPADFDGDGRTDVAVRTNTAALVFYQMAPGVWRRSLIATLATGEGMARGDINADGRIDLVLRGIWLRNPGGSRARTGSAWTSYPIGPAPQNFKALAMDLDGDRKLEVVYTSSENTADVTVWRRQSGDPRIGWIPTVAMAAVDRAHTLGSGDMDGDGDRDLVVGQMHTSTLKRLMVIENLDGLGRQWLPSVVATGGLHNGRVVDIDLDGDPDIFGANWTGNPPVRLWLNER